MASRLFAVLSLVAVLAAAPAAAQVPTAELPASPPPATSQAGFAQQPRSYTVAHIEVRGVPGEQTRNFVRRTSGLEVDQTITLPGEALAGAIRAIYELGLYSNVRIMKEALPGDRLNLIIIVKPEPRLGSYAFEGVKKSERNDLKEQVPLLAGRPVQPGEVERTTRIVKDFFADKGYRGTQVDVQRSQLQDGRTRLVFDVDKGQKLEVQDIRFEGNTAFEDGDLRGQFEETKENRWWRFWKGETFNRDEFEGDLDKLLSFYREEGYYDAQIVSDSVYQADGGIDIEVRVEEGQRYYIRNIEWEGNTVYPNAALTSALGFEKGDPYNGKKLQENLTGNQSSSDVNSLYMDRGYLYFQATPSVRVVGGDSLDLTFDVREGSVFEFGDITISGNTKTKDHVIRRELYTVPGQTFSRSAIQESIRRLSQLQYFDQQALSGGPSVEPDPATETVDLTYEVSEVGSDQLELSGTYSGYIGVILQLGFTFNNFSAQNLFNPEAYKPLPSGDGQKLSLSLRASGTRYQSYSLSFTEPWFRGRPTPIGGSISYSRLQGRLGLYGRGSDDGLFQTLSSRLFYQQRLDWPDDKFTTSSAVRYQLYENNDYYSQSSYIPDGLSQQVSFEQSLSRSSIDNPLFPTTGSKMDLSLEVAPPFGDLAQFYKARFKTSWNLPIAGKLSFNFSTDYGYIGSITGDPVEFQLFDVGGSPLDAQGFANQTFGRDLVYMRGYPQGSINPRSRISSDGFGVEVGGTILNKYTSELRWLAVQSQQLQAAPYVYLDAANTWRGFDTFDPASLYRSGGVGMRLFLPIVGLIDLNYGYNFDEFIPAERGESGLPQWRFQISLGQSFGSGQ